MPPGRRHRAVPHSLQTDLVAYELHLRDFSMSDAKAFPHRIVANIWRSRAKSNGVRHLNQLARAGVTDVHLFRVRHRHHRRKLHHRSLRAAQPTPLREMVAKRNQRFALQLGCVSLLRPGSCDKMTMARPAYCNSGKW